MKKILLLLVFTGILNSMNIVVAQTKNIQETEKLLCGTKWILIEEIEAGKKTEAYLKGLIYTFRADHTGSILYPEKMQARAKELNMQMEFNWDITSSNLTLKNKKEKIKYTYNIKDDNGIKLFMTDDEGTFVYKQIEE